MKGYLTILIKKNKNAGNWLKEECSEGSLWNFSTVCIYSVQSFFTASVHLPTSLTYYQSMLIVHLLLSSKYRSTFPHKPAERHYSLSCKSSIAKAVIALFIFLRQSKRIHLLIQPNKPINHCLKCCFTPRWNPPITTRLFPGRKLNKIKQKQNHKTIFFKHKIFTLKYMWWILQFNTNFRQQNDSFLWLYQK